MAGITKARLPALASDVYGTCAGALALRDAANLTGLSDGQKTTWRTLLGAAARLFDGLTGTERRTARGNLGYGVKVYSFGDVDTSLSSSDYAAAVEALLQACIDANGLFVIPQGSWSTVRGLAVTGCPNIQAEGDWTIPTNEPHLTCNITAATRHKSIIGLNCINTIGLANLSTAAVRFTGNYLLERCFFNRIRSEGCYRNFWNCMGVFVSVHGDESYFNNNKLFGLSAFYTEGGVEAAKYVVEHRDGSGTGNEYESLTGNISRLGTQVGDIEEKPATLRIGALTLSTVIGDITYRVGQITGKDNAVISIDLCSYMSKVNLIGGQVDAQARYLLRTTTTPAAPLYDWRSNVVIGGEIDVGSFMPRFTGSVIELQAVDRRGAEVSQPIADPLPTGAQTYDLFQIDLGQYTGVDFEFTVNGLVQGLAGGGVSWRGHIKSNDTTATVVSYELNTDNGSASFFVLSMVVTGLSVALSVAFTATTTGSAFSSSVVCKNGRDYRLIRIDQTT